MKAHLVLRMDVITVLTMIVVSCLDGPAAANQTTEAGKQNGDSVETNIEGSVVNADGEPIAKAWVSCLGYAGDDANDFEPVYVRTDEQGRFQAGVPSGRFRVHINSPSDEYDDIDGFGVRNGAAICSWDGVVDRSTGEKISVLATLPRAYDLRFNLVDSKTGQTVPDAAILYKDDEAFWVEEFDYETWASWIVYRVFEDGLAIFKKETSATMRLAHIQILASGYKPVRLKLDEKLERGKRLVKQVRMQPLPVVELAVAAHGGGPAAGAEFESIRPAEFQEIFRDRGGKHVQRLLDIDASPDERGVLQLRYPAFGDWAAYRVRHASGYADFKIEDLPAAADGGSTIRQRIELAPFAMIQGTYLPEVAENEFLEVYRLKSNRMTVDTRSLRVSLDESGRFELGPRLAGWHSFVHRIRYSDERGRKSTSAVALYGPFKVTNGQTVRLKLGDQGRPLVGRLLLPDGMAAEGHVLQLYIDSDTFPGRPHAPADIQDGEALAAWWDAFWESDEGRRYWNYSRRSGSTTAESDGRFRFPMLRPGNYTLRLSHKTRGGPRLTLGETEFEIPEGYSPKPLDLHDLQLSLGR